MEMNSPVRLGGLTPVRLGALMLVLPVLAVARFPIAASAMALSQPAAPARYALPRANPGSAASSSANQGYLGVDIRDVSDEDAVTLKLKERCGAEVIHVDHDGPAGKLGLRRHDVILEMNGQEIKNQAQLRQMLRDTPAGQSVKLVISRDGRQQTMSTQLANREEVERRAWEQHLVVPDPGPDFQPAPHVGNGFLHASPSPNIGAKAHRDFLGTTTVLNASFTGAQLEVMGPQLAEYFGVEGNAGLLVRSVEANSPAANAGLRAGDVVVRVNEVAVTSGNEWSRAIHQNKGKPVALVVLRNKHEQTMTMTPDGKKRSSVVWPFGDKEHSMVAEM